MSFSFKKILIPADLSINTEVAVQKGLALADEQTTIHMLYVHSRAGGCTSNNLEELRNNKQLPGLKEPITALDHWKKYIEANAKGVKVYSSISMNDSVQKTIEEKAKEFGVDLVVIGKKSNHSLFPFLNTVVPGRIVMNTGIAVLTVKPGCMEHHIKTVIVPVTGRITKQKMNAIGAICGRYRVSVHLVTFMGNRKGPSDFNASALLTLYQWLRAHLRCPVSYAVLHGHNKALALMKYANQINADILLVHPETETRVGWLNTQISDVLPPASKVQVLAVHEQTA